MAFNNLADILARSQRYPDVLVAAEQAVQIGGDQQAVFTQTLSEVKSKIAAMQ